MILLVVNEEFAIWKDASTQTLLRGDPLKHIDVEGMRVVTNNRCVAERIKSDKVESVATGRQKNGKFGNVGRRQNLKSIVMNGVNIGEVGKVGKWEKSQTEEDRKDQNEEKLCTSITKGGRKTQS